MCPDLSRRSVCVDHRLKLYAPVSNNAMLTDVAKLRVISLFQKVTRNQLIVIS